MNETDHQAQANQESPIPSHATVAQMIAERLHEAKEPQLTQIHHITWALGAVQAWAFLLDTLETEEKGGMMLPDGSRRRTLGGTFFYLVRTKGVPEPGKQLKFTYNMRKKTATQTEQSTTQPDQVQQPQQAPFLWEDRVALIEGMTETEKGTATTVKITLIGTIGKYVDKGACIVGVMQSSDKMPSLPKGVPTPPATKTNYVVYIGSKQWKNVATAASDPDDAFIIEGYPQIDAQTKAISVFATNITTKKIQAAKKKPEKPVNG